MTTSICGQTLDEAQGRLVESLRNSQFTAAFAGLIVFSDELELSGANYDIDNGDGNVSNTELSSFSIPFKRLLTPWEESRARVYIEGVIGYGKASQGAGDLYSGLNPSIKTSVDSDAVTYSGLVGAGLEFMVLEQLAITPIVNVGIAHIKSEADYSGPGAVYSAALLDGIAFNWDGWTTTGGLGCRVDWTQPLAGNYELTLIGRYDTRWTETFKTDSSAQEFSNRIQIITLRSDIVGPTSLTPFGRELSWRILAGYRHFIEESLFEVQEIILLGTGLEYDVAKLFPIGKTLELNAGVILGEDISGYSVGLGITF